MNRDIWLLSGPNLDRFGKRDPEIYGTQTLAEFVGDATEVAGANGAALHHLQSANEAELIAAIHRATDEGALAIIINAAAFTHYAWGIHDALAEFKGVTVELHVSNPQRREPWRHDSVIAPVAQATIAGCGPLGYRFAVEAAVHLSK